MAYFFRFICQKQKIEDLIFFRDYNYRGRERNEGFAAVAHDIAAILSFQPGYGDIAV